MPMSTRESVSGTSPVMSLCKYRVLPFSAHTIAYGVQIHFVPYFQLKRQHNIWLLLGVPTFEEACCTFACVYFRVPVLYGYRYNRKFYWILIVAD